MAIQGTTGHIERIKKHGAFMASQTESVGKATNIIDGTPTIQGRKHDSVTAGVYVSHPHSSHPIGGVRESESKLTAAGSYETPRIKQA